MEKQKKYWLELDQRTYDQIEHIMDQHKLHHPKIAAELALNNYMNLYHANQVARMKIEQLDKEIRRHEYQVDIFAQNLGKYLDKIAPDVIDSISSPKNSTRWPIGLKQR